MDAPGRSSGRRRVLIAGASGFIGAHLVRAVSAAGHESAALVREGAPVDRLDGVEHVTLLQGDLDRPDEVVGKIADFAPDICLDAAWGRPGERSPGAVHERSRRNALRLARLMADVGCSRHLHTGTCFEYRPSDDPLSEDSPTEPHTEYGVNKLEVTRGIEAIAGETGMSAAAPRIFYVYGPFEAPVRLVPAVIGGLLRGERTPTSAGLQVRDYLHVEDVASAIWTVAESEVEGPVNIASGRPVPVRTVIETIAGQLGRAELLDVGALPYRPEEPPAIRADTRRLSGLGWRPRYTLDRGIEETIAWWRGRLAEEPT